MPSGSTSPSYIHVKIAPDPEVKENLRDLMREVHFLVAERLKDQAVVVSSSSMNPSAKHIDENLRELTEKSPEVRILDMGPGVPMEPKGPAG